MSEKRQSPRVTNENELAWIDPRTDSPPDFQKSIVGLVPDQSDMGCGLVVLESAFLQPGETCQIQIGDQAARTAEIRWQSNFDNQVRRLGLMFR